MIEKMRNLEIARIFFEMADILEMKGVQWKPQAFRKAAQNIESLAEDVNDIFKRNELRKIPGVGEGIAKKIEEFLKTGKIKSYERLKKQIPKGLDKLIKVPGLGPKKAIIRTIVFSD